jgi:orotidine-5'-phosphate decarboxylase
MTKTADKIIVALDLASKTDALDLVRRLREQISFFKIGLELYTASGFEIVREVLGCGVKVFLDLKLHDIPNTVGRAVEAAARLGVHMLTIHLSGGSEMIRAAVTARNNGVLVLGVTVLTSADEQMLRQTGVAESIDSQVLRLARLGVANGIDGVISSPRDIVAIRAEFGDRLKIVTPGVRPAWSQAGDQKRTGTPRQAIEAGADYVVIGRPITSHSNPSEAVRLIISELQ